VLSGRWPLTFRLALLDKDVGICLDLLRELGLSGPLLDRAGELLHEARASLDPDADYLAPIRLAEQRAGVELRG
jgi:3-hydroxyisobutyrate dehydrogenase